MGINNNFKNIRLDKFLADCNVCTRSEAKKYVKNGKVYVNGSLTLKVDAKVSKVDKIIFLGKEVNYNKYTYIMLNKPKGVISATYDENAKTVIDLLGYKYKNLKLFPVGRLDKDTTGILILTNNGEFAHNTLSPKKHIQKAYVVKLDGEVTNFHINEFLSGVIINHKDKCMPAILTINYTNKDISEVIVKIKEGKYHQIKKMFGVYSLGVLELERISFGEIYLDKYLEYGEYRKLNEIEETYVNSFIKKE